MSKSSGKSLTLLSNMRLYNGYHVTTSARSYAWMNLDDAKHIKEDAASEVEVRKSGKVLEVNVCSGSVFFDVSEQLEDDESLNISTSTMIVGIRGTAGYVEVVDRWTTELTVLEGVVQCSVADPVTGQIKSEAVRGGETVQRVVYPQDQPGDKCDILREKTAVEDIPGYVLTDVVRDMELCDRIEADTGTDILEELAKIVGGDPSGRSEDGLSASPEVLGEADRRENLDETKLQEKQEQVDAGQKAQESGESGDKVFAQTPGQSGFSDDSGSSGGPSAPASGTRTMPQTSAGVQALLDQYEAVILQPGANAGDNTLLVDSPLSVASGKSLTLDNGVGMQVQAGTGLQVDGTLAGGSLVNNGITTVTSGNTLRLNGSLSGSGQLIVTATGRVVVEGSCTWGSAALTSGAQVLSKNGFGNSPIPSGWEVSAAADSSGYYSLVETASAPGQTCTVAFHPNGGNWDSSTEQKSFTTGTDGKLTGGPADPTRDGFSFDGWNTAADGSGTAIAADDLAAHTFIADTILYAQWKIKTYTVSFGGCGGQVPSQTVEHGGHAAMPSPDPALEGYRFVNWYETTTYSNPLNFDTYVVTGNIEIEAKFEVCEYTVTFDLNGPPAGVTQPASQPVKYQYQVSRPAISEPDGYRLLGWYKEAGCINEWDFDTDTMGGADMTLYAKWQQVKFKITFDPNGGTGGGTVQTDTGGKLASGSIPANPAGDAAKKFLGWYDAQTGGTQIDPATHTFTVNTTLYARWSYAVTLDNNGFGQWGIGDAPTDPQTFWTDANGILTANSNNVSPSDLYSQSNDLMSWNSKQDGTGDSITDVNLTAHKFTAAGIWYAQWESY